MIVSYKWLQAYFAEPLPSSEKVTETLTFGVFEVESTEKKGDDTVFDIKVLPDRAHDCLSHRGIARVLGTLLDMPLRPVVNFAYAKSTTGLRAEPIISLPEQKPTTLAVEILDKTMCRRYIGCVVRGVKVGPSPAWLTERLEAIGQRSINNVVDATNYVMFDIGQPLHAFDKDKLSGEKIIVRKTGVSEHIITLDGKDITLPENVLVIADEKEPLAIAGVKGGKKAEVDEHTTAIVLEAANFDPVSVRKTSRALGILTDSSKRFENDLTPELAKEAIDRVTALIVEVAGNDNTIVEKIVDVCSAKLELRTITISAKDANRLLGTTLSDEDIEKFLNRLKFFFEKKGSPATFIVTAPPERLDLKETADLVEDIAHVYGYGNIPSVAPQKEQTVVDKKFYYTTLIRTMLASGGFSEIYGYSFASEGEIELQNPLASDHTFLRANLNDGILNALSKNAGNVALLGLTFVRIFEFGNVFHKSGEKTLLAVGVHHLKKTKEGVLRTTLAKLAEEIGAPSLPVVGGYDLSDGMREVVAIDIDALVGALSEPEGEYSFPESTSVQYKPFSPYPFIARDIAVWVPEGIDRSVVTDIILAEGGDLLVQGPTLFDEFKKDGKISYAFRFVFQSPDRTLTDEEVNKIMERIYARLSALDYTVR